MNKMFFYDFGFKEWKDKLAKLQTENIISYFPSLTLFEYHMDRYPTKSRSQREFDEFNNVTELKIRYKLFVRI